jgi:hypothetical protein
MAQSLNFAIGIHQRTAAEIPEAVRHTLASEPVVSRR